MGFLAVTLAVSLMVPGAAVTEPLVETCDLEAWFDAPGVAEQGQILDVEVWVANSGPAECRDVTPDWQAWDVLHWLSGTYLFGDEVPVTGGALYWVGRIQVDPLSPLTTVGAWVIVGASNDRDLTNNQADWNLDVVARAGVERVAGPDRYGTAAALSNTRFVPYRPVALVATGEGFPDALAGGPLAVREAGPILLVSKDRIPEPTATELTRLKPGLIVILGGTGAVSAKVADQLAAFSPAGVLRLAGVDRYSTAAAISRAGFDPGVPVVLVATGENFPDALAGAPLAAIRGGPILLTRKDTLPSATVNELQRLDPASIVILGGEGAVSAAVAAQLAAYTEGPVDRLAGADRYSTATAISREGFDSGVKLVFVATGDNYPDALAAGPVAGQGGHPVLLVRKDTIPAATHQELTRLKPESIVILGGTGAISTAVETQLAAYLATSR